MRTYQIIKNGIVEVITAQELVSNNKYRRCVIITDTNRQQFQKQITQYNRDQKLKSIGI